MRFLWLILIGSCLLSVPLHAQPAGATFLLISPSPHFNGMGGGTGVAVPTDDPYAPHYNPANGLRQRAGLSTTVSTMSTVWLPRISNQLRYDYTVAAVTYRPRSARWALGGSYHYSWFDMGRQQQVNDPALYRSYARADIGYLQASYQDSLWIVPWRVAVGLGGKIALQQFAGGDSARSQNLWGDVGLLWTAALPVPIPGTAGQLYLTARPTLGVSRLNYGAPIEFVLAPYPELAPRTIRVGGTLQLALQWHGTRDLVRYTHSHAAADVLAQSMDPVRYQSGWGDLDLEKHIWRNRADDRVMVYAGTEWRFLEAVAWRTGRFQDVGGAIDVTTTGYGIYPMAVLRPVVDWLCPQSLVTKLMHHVAIQYDYSAYTTPKPNHPLSGITFTAWRVTLRRLEQFFSPGVWSD